MADGRVVMALEGGYSLPSLCDAAELCVKALLGDKVRLFSYYSKGGFTENSPKGFPNIFEHFSKISRRFS